MDVVCIGSADGVGVASGNGYILGKKEYCVCAVIITFPDQRTVVTERHWKEC